MCQCTNKLLTYTKKPHINHTHVLHQLEPHEKGPWVEAQTGGWANCNLWLVVYVNQSYHIFKQVKNSLFAMLALGGRSFI